MEGMHPEGMHGRVSWRGFDGIVHGGSIVCVLSANDNDTAIPIFVASNVLQQTLSSQQPLLSRLVVVPRAEDRHFL